MTKDHLPVENCPGLVRDMSSKAVLVTDITEYANYRKRRQREEHLLSIEKKLDELLAMKKAEASV